MRKHQIDEAVFDNVQTQEVAYVLGFFAADGHNTPRGIRFKIKRADRVILEEISRVLCTDMRIVDFVATVGGKPYEQSRMYIYSPRLSARLSALGCPPGKSFTALPWEGPADLMRHYWRGVFDGDGSFPRVAGKSHGVDLVGSLPMMQSFAGFINDRLGFLPLVKPTKGIWRVRVTNLERKQAVARLLYDGATIALPRKRQRVEELLAYQCKYRDWSHLTCAMLLQLREEHGDWTGVAAFLDADLSWLIKRARKLGFPRVYRDHSA